MFAHSKYVLPASQIPLRSRLGVSDLDYFAASAADESALATCHYCSVPVNKMCLQPRLLRLASQTNKLTKPINHFWMWMPAASCVDFSLSKKVKCVIWRPRGGNDRLKERIFNHHHLSSTSLQLLTQHAAGKQTSTDTDTQLKINSHVALCWMSNCTIGEMLCFHLVPLPPSGQTYLMQL